MTEKRYLLTTLYDDGDFVPQLMTAAQVVTFLNFLDLYDYIEDYHIFSFDNLGHFEELHYAGWQPDCYIEVLDKNNEMVFCGYGEDH